MLMPKRVMRRYVHRGKRRGKPLRGSQINFGEYGLQAMEAGWITNNQIESARIAITRYVRRGGKLWIKVFPHKPLSKQPAETRMGKGKKGPPEYWVAVAKPGRVLFELSGVSLEDAKGAMARAAHKLPIKTKFVARNV